MWSSYDKTFCVWSVRKTISLYPSLNLDWTNWFVASIFLSFSHVKCTVWKYSNLPIHKHMPLFNSSEFKVKSSMPLIAQNVSVKLPITGFDALGLHHYKFMCVCVQCYIIWQEQDKARVWRWRTISLQCLWNISLEWRKARKKLNNWVWVKAS